MKYVAGGKKQDTPPNNVECSDVDWTDEEHETSELETLYHSPTKPDQADNTHPITNNLEMISPTTATLDHNPNQNHVIDLNNLHPRQP